MVLEQHHKKMGDSYFIEDTFNVTNTLWTKIREHLQSILSYSPVIPNNTTHKDILVPSTLDQQFLFGLFPFKNDSLGES